MRSFVIAILALAVALSASGSAMAAVTDPDGLIVRFEPGVSAAERAAIRDEAGTDLELTLPVRGMQLLDLEPGQGRAAAERALERQDGVLYAEPNAVRRASLRPDDLHFSLLWGLENTGQAIRGSAGSIDADTDAGDAWDAGIGGGGAVAVIDSGVDLAHPDLAANAWRNPGESGAGRETNGLDDDLNGRVDDWRGWDFVAGDSDPADENRHGTHVAGPDWAPRGNGGDDGIGDDNDIYPEYPCAYPLPNVVCVAASDNRDRLATFSNYGDLSVDLAAPRVDNVGRLPGRVGGADQVGPDGGRRSGCRVRGPYGQRWAAECAELAAVGRGRDTGAAGARPEPGALARHRPWRLRGGRLRGGRLRWRTLCRGGPPPAAGQDIDRRPRAAPPVG